jgi:hypothetical protein
MSIEAGFWRTQPVPLRHGQYAYKFLIDGRRWLDDPNNPRKAPDGVGGLNSTLVVPEAGRTRVSEDDKRLSMGTTQIRG